MLENHISEDSSGAFGAGEWNVYTSNWIIPIELDGVDDASLN